MLKSRYQNAGNDHDIKSPNDKVHIERMTKIITDQNYSREEIKSRLTFRNLASYI